MKLSKLYSNKPELFETVDFVSGLNVVMAEIRLPENRERDTHNLGKSILGRVLDFGFLSTRDARFFLFRHFNLFSEFVFYLEIQLMDASYVTIRRSVEEASKVSFKKHEASHQDFTSLPDADWDHVQLPFERSQEMLDSLLDWRALKPWSYRKGTSHRSPWRGRRLPFGVGLLVRHQIPASAPHFGQATTQHPAGRI
jgi:uncharacterized protein YydD (DUF2326 family)